MIAPSTIERIKDIPIVDVISKFVTDLKRTGQNYSAKSPFNNEKTASFHVVPAKNFFKCFSSGKGGDAITFVMEHEKVDYVEAIKIIAGKFGERVEYEISEKATEEQSEKELLFLLNLATSIHYNKQLEACAANHPAMVEIAKRCFTTETINQFQIGYAPGDTSNGYQPDDWKFLTKMLHEKGHIDPALKIGLVKKAKDGNVYDIFRNRIMFPIHNHLGRIVGFGGRWIGKPDDFNAKYINTGETPLYNKSNVLYGLHQAGANIRKHGYAYLTEGYTDVISFHQAGFFMTVAPCGTALTEMHCKLLRRYCDKVVIFPDPDFAGENSTLVNIDMLISTGFEVGVVPLPKSDDGKKIDPDELVRAFDQMKVTTVSLGDNIETSAVKMMELDTNDPEVQRLVTDTGKKKQSKKKHGKA